LPSLCGRCNSRLASNSPRSLHFSPVAPSSCPLRGACRNRQVANGLTVGIGDSHSTRIRWQSDEMEGRECYRFPRPRYTRMLPLQQMKTPIWPYIAVVACLFILSLLAPHTWLRHGVPPPQPETAGPK